VNAAVNAHLDYLGRWCPGHGIAGHPADGLTVRSGRVLCGYCSDRHAAEVDQ
jgi:hypothetical protein